jgi:3-deoxy-D-manno-octulosonate 8-phosphate phosphatase (KDO 8-P phosphatase)
MSSPADITLLALDVDGVLTDGSILIDDDRRETKRFHVRDGVGISAWRKLGFEVAILTGRSGRAVAHRAEELGITHVLQGLTDKSAGLDTLVSRCAVPREQIAYVGDDWPDLAVMRRAGYAIAVADADPRVRAAAAWTTTIPGGHGAVREAIEHLLSAKGLLEKAAGLFGPYHA